MKTELTKELERAIFKETKADKLGVYGAFEVAIGKGYGDEYADYMTMTSANEFRCYEIKITRSDYKSNNKLSFYGDFNYLVMPEELYQELEEKHELHYDVGIYTYKDGRLTLMKKPSRKTVRIDQRIMLMHCMIRSLSRLTTKSMKSEEINNELQMREI